MRVEARTSQNALHLAFDSTMPELWGKSLALVYEPATAAGAAKIASYGGLTRPPRFTVHSL